MLALLPAAASGSAPPDRVSLTLPAPRRGMTWLLGQVLPLLLPRQVAGAWASLCRTAWRGMILSQRLLYGLRTDSEERKKRASGRLWTGSDLAWSQRQRAEAERESELDQSRVFPLSSLPCSLQHFSSDAEAVPLSPLLIRDRCPFLSRLCPFPLWIWLSCQLPQLLMF